MHCFKCKSELDLPGRKIGFRQHCLFCSADLHVCKNCLHYIIGKPNDCNVPYTEFVSDREKNNFCEDFEIKDEGQEKSRTKTDVSKKLFKDPGEDPKKNGFDSLFKD